MQSFVIGKVNKITQKNRITPLCLSLNYSTYFFRDTGLPRDHLWRLHIHILSQYWFVSLILFGMLSSFLSWIYLSFRDLVSLSFSFCFFFHFFFYFFQKRSIRILSMHINNERYYKKKKKRIASLSYFTLIFFFFSNE